MAETQHGGILVVIDRGGHELSRVPVGHASAAVGDAIKASAEHGRAVIVSLTYDVPPRLHAMDYAEGKYTGGRTYDLPGREG